MSSQTTIKTAQELGLPANVLTGTDWEMSAVMSEQCLSYVVWNKETREALVVDPKREDLDAYLKIAEQLKGYLWLGVIDTHTHADHISIAADLAKKLSTPLVMHCLSVTPRADLRVSHETTLPAHAAPVKIIPTPGHTPDSLTILWGPFLFGGDTILYADVGRDDLPGGSPAAHFESIERLKQAVPGDAIVLPGHDHRGGRASLWSEQLKINSSLTQPRDEFIREAAAFDAPAPKLLKESLRENFR